MYNGGKIILGLIIFLLLITLPVWFNIATGTSKYKPNPKILPGQTECVAPANYMRTSHMRLLDEWRDEVVRHQRRYGEINGKIYELSLSNTCMKCHSNKKEFCDECHNFADVNPYCWECHIEPKEK